MSCNISACRHHHNKYAQIWNENKWYYGIIMRMMTINDIYLILRVDIYHDIEITRQWRRSGTIPIKSRPHKMFQTQYYSMMISSSEWLFICRGEARKRPRLLLSLARSGDDAVSGYQNARLKSSADVFIPRCSRAPREALIHDEVAFSMAVRAISCIFTVSAAIWALRPNINEAAVGNETRRQACFILYYHAVYKPENDVIV